MHTPAQQPPRDRGGFSMAELLVVIVIIGIGMAMFIPRLQGVAKVSAIQGALNRVAGDLSYARIRAIRNGARGQVIIGTDGRSYRVVVDPGSANQESRTVSMTNEFPGVVLSPASGVVTFDSRGLMVTGGATVIRATRQGQTDSLRVTGVGVIYRDF